MNVFLHLWFHRCNCVWRNARKSCVIVCSDVDCINSATLSLLLFTLHYVFTVCLSVCLSLCL